VAAGLPPAVATGAVVGEVMGRYVTLFASPSWESVDIPPISR